MKASELIKNINIFVERYGDCNIGLRHFCGSSVGDPHDDIHSVQFNRISEITEDIDGDICPENERDTIVIVYE